MPIRYVRDRTAVNNEAARRGADHLRDGGVCDVKRGCDRGLAHDLREYRTYPAVEEEVAAADQAPERGPGLPEDLSEPASGQCSERIVSSRRIPNAAARRSSPQACDGRKEWLP